MTLVRIGYRIFRNSSNYFDRKAVMDAMDKATHKVFSKFGAFVRTRDITSMLRHNPPKGFGSESMVSNRPGSAPVGTPPHPHVGTIVKHVEFWWDPIAQSVVIGPPLFIGKTGSRNVLASLEYSGPSLTIRKGQIVPTFVRERPSINPAFEAEKPRLPQMWKDAMDKI